MRTGQFKQLIESAGMETAVHTVRDLLEGRQLQNGAKYQVKPEEFSLKGLWEAFVGPPEQTLPTARQSAVYLTEQVDSTGFNAVTRMLINAKVIEGYNSVKGIGDALVTNMPSKRRVENITGFTEMEGLKQVAEGMPYEDSSIGEKYVVAQAFKKGRLISITEELIMEDQTGQLLMRAGRFGQRAAMDKERTILTGVLDINSNVWRPSGTATALYSTANGNLVGTAGALTGWTAAKPLVDWNDLASVEDFHGQSISDDRQMGPADPILVNFGQLLVPKGLEGVALRIRNATQVISNTGVSGNVPATQTTYNNPKAGRFDVLSSPFIVRLGGLSTTWFYGDFPQQFIWQDIWPIQTFSQDASGPEGFLRDVVAIYKVRYLGGIAALDTRYVVKILGA